jgi:opacity protein-like surface antigen
VARAQGFVGILLGYNFGGNSTCEGIRNCEEKHRNLGVSVGAVGKAGGFEAELSFANELLGKTPATSSRVTTLMGNSVAGPRWGAVQPYGLIGVGLIRMHVETDGTLVEANHDENQFGWDGGFGVIVWLGPVAVRGDIRHFNSFQDSDFLRALTGDDAKLDFSRLSGSVLIKF